MNDRSRNAIRVTTIAMVVNLSLGRGVSVAQSDPDDCGNYHLNGNVLECAASGSVRAQLRTATFIAGSVATGETLAQAIALEVGTAPLGSSSGGFTFTFDPKLVSFIRTSPSFGPAFSERILTLGKGKLNAGFNFLDRKYDTVEGLDLKRFDVFRFRGGGLAVRLSTLELEARTDTVSAFAQYGLLNNLDVGVMVPWVHVSLSGTSRALGEAGEELQRVLLDGSHSGIGDISIFGKYRFWQFGPAPAVGAAPNGGLAAAVAVRLPTGDEETLVGLGLTRTLVSLIGSASYGRFSPHVNVGYEFWSKDVSIERTFQTTTDTVSAGDQFQYAAGFEYAVHDRLTIIEDVLGRYLRGGGRLGYQPFTFPANAADVRGAEALVAIADGVNTVILAPGAKWNFYSGALLTANVLISLTREGLQDRVTPVMGIEWSF
jgi:Putative MetA-pathway of phenol degradation